jgi:hypothetical protein
MIRDLSEKLINSLQTKTTHENPQLKRKLESQREEITSK